MRLFVALTLAPETRQALSLLTSTLPGARWVAPENYHLTLRFIGEVAPDQAEDIDLALAALRGRGFALEMSGVGTFAKGERPTALWVGVAANPALMHLRGKVETALQRAGLPPERRRFTPHVAIARLDNPHLAPLGAFIQAHNLRRFPPTPVAQVALFRSVLGKDQAHYTIEAEYELA